MFPMQRLWLLDVSWYSVSILDAMFTMRIRTDFYMRIQRMARCKFFPGIQVLLVLQPTARPAEKTGYGLMPIQSRAALSSISVKVNCLDGFYELL
jgi:hypothetical protein